MKFKIIAIMLSLIFISGCDTEKTVIAPTFEPTQIPTSSPSSIPSSTPSPTPKATAETLSSFNKDAFELDHIYPLLYDELGLNYNYSLYDGYYIIEDNNLFGLINEKKQLSLNATSIFYPHSHGLDWCLKYFCGHNEYQEILQNTKLHECYGHGGGNENIGYDKTNDKLYIITAAHASDSFLVDFKNDELSENSLISYSELYDVEYVENDFSKYKETGKLGVINSNGEIITEAIYDDVFDIESSLKPVKKGGLWGYVNSSGEEVIPCAYQAVFGSYETHDYNADYEYVPRYPYPVINDRIVVKNWDDKYGVIDVWGTTLIEFEYDFASPYYNNSVILKKDGEWIVK